MERMRNAGSGPAESNRTFTSSAEIESSHMVEVELKHTACEAGLFRAMRGPGSRMWSLAVAAMPPRPSETVGALSSCRLDSLNLA